VAVTSSLGLTVMMEMDPVSEMLVFSSTSTRLMTRENFIMCYVWVTYKHYVVLYLFAMCV
jgi:hypothetical protein